MDPLISVIIPIYNVENYLRRCLDSLKNQTLKQIEVIMVDDGSTDESREVAEEYVSDDWPVFRLIHFKINRGLSVARNIGIEESQAEWIMFVDSDDWVKSEFCRIPYEAAIENAADMVIFNAYRVKKGRITNPEIMDNPNGIVDEITAHEYGGCVAWNKLYRREFFLSVKYPKDRVYEDIATTHKLVHEAKQIYMLQEKLYYHMIRRGSITHSNLLNSRRDRSNSILLRCRDLISYDYSDSKMEKKWNMLYGPAIGFLAREKNNSDELYFKAKNIVNSIKGFPEELSWKQKVALVAWRVDRKCFQFLCIITRRMKK